MSKPHQYTIRELMPRGYTKILKQETGRAPAYITKVVTQEVKSSPIWKNVLELAEKTKTKIQEEEQRIASIKSKPAA